MYKRQVLPLGTLTVEETKAPNGYLLEGAYMQTGDKSEQIKGLYLTQIPRTSLLARWNKQRAAQLERLKNRAEKSAEN